MSKSKRKGSVEERAVVNLHRELGFVAERTLESGARSDGTSTWDVNLLLGDKNNTSLRGECKVRANGFSTIYSMLADADFLTIRADRKRRLYVMPEDTWLLLISLINSYGRVNNEQQEKEN